MTHNAVQESCVKELINRERNNDICQQVTAIIMCIITVQVQLSETEHEISPGWRYLCNF